MAKESGSDTSRSAWFNIVLHEWGQLVTTGWVVGLICVVTTALMTILASVFQWGPNAPVAASILTLLWAVVVLPIGAAHNVWRRERLARIESDDMRSTLQEALSKVQSELTVVTTFKEDRQRVSQQLHLFYAEGASLRNVALQETHTDEMITKLHNDATGWINVVNNWIVKNMGAAASARLLDSSGFLPLSYSLKGEHSAEITQTRNSIINSLAIWLRNIDTLVKTAAYDK